MVQRPLDYYTTLRQDHMLGQMKVKYVRTSTEIHLHHKKKDNY